MSAPDATQLEYWNGPAAQRWIAARERLDRSLARITTALFECAAPRAGERVLDVGCGCGTTSLLLREQVAPGGAVLGVDISGPMLAVARASAPGPDLEFLEADAAVHRFPPSFDLLFSRFGLMFFDDPIAAFANLRGALAPGGRVAFVCWRSPKENDWVMTPMAAARDLLPPSPPVDPRAPGPFVFADRDYLAEILAGAGYQEVEIAAHDDKMFVGNTVADAADHALTVGPLSRAASELPESVRQTIWSRVAAAMERSAGPDGVNLSSAAWLVRCAAPA